MSVYKIDNIAYNVASIRKIDEWNYGLLLYSMFFLVDLSVYRGLPRY